MKQCDRKQQIWVPIRPSMEALSAPAALSARGAAEAMPMNPDRSTDSLKFSASMKVDVPLLRFLTGKRGKTKEKIEEETKTQLFIPFPHEVKKGSCLVVKGPSQEEVDEAVVQIQKVLQEAAASPSLDYTHFISLPLSLHPALVEQMTKFQDSVLAPLSTANQPVIRETVSLMMETAEKTGDSVEEVSTVSNVKGDMSVRPFAETRKDDSYFIGKVGVAENELRGQFNDDMEQDRGNLITENDGEGLEEPMNDDDESDEDKPGVPSQMGYGIEKSIFVSPTKLHLTVLMLKLWNKDLVALAAEVLQGVRPKLLEALEGRPVAVHLRGLECMRGSPQKAHVLYAKVEEADKENRLARGCQVIIDAFSEAGLVSEKDKKQKLKLHVTLMNTKYRKRKRGKRFSRQLPFDARQILVKYGLEDFGEHRILEAQLSERSAYGEDGYYRCFGSIKFPSNASLEK